MFNRSGKGKRTEVSISGCDNYTLQSVKNMKALNKFILKIVFSINDSYKTFSDHWYVINNIQYLRKIETSYIFSLNHKLTNSNREK